MKTQHQWKTGLNPKHKFITVLVMIGFLLINGSSVVDSNRSFVDSKCLTTQQQSIFTTDSLSASLWVNDESDWVKSLEKTVGTELEFKVEVTEAKGLYLIVTVILPEILEYTGQANPDPMDVTSNEYGSQNLYWCYSNGGGSRTFYYHAKIKKPGLNETHAVAVLLIPEESSSDSVQIKGVSSNQPPTADAGGPYTGKIGTSIQLDGGNSSDSDGTIISYEWDLDGDEEFDDATGITPVYTGSTAGTFIISLKVTDDDNATGIDETTVEINQDDPPENHPPDRPVRPDGETSGKIGEKYRYTTMTSDQDDDEIWFKWDWGDGTSSEWIGPYTSRSVVETSHSWDDKDEYEIKVKAKDEHGMESEWSDPLEASMPMNKIFNPFSWLIDFTLEIFPFLECFIK